MKKNIFVNLIFFLGGLLIATMILKSDFAFRYLQRFNWQPLITYTLSIIVFFAALVLAIFINRESIGKAEITKIQAEVIRERLSYIKGFKSLIAILKTSTTHDKTYGEMINKLPYLREDQKNNKVLGKSCLISKDVYNQFCIKLYEYLNALGTIPSSEISDWIDYTRIYFVLLNTVVEKFNDDNIWELSVIVYKDISEIAKDIDIITDQYANKILKKLNFNEHGKFKKMCGNEDVMIKIEETNLYKIFN